MTNRAPNIWTQMNYVPPRGQCNFKQSVLSPRCPCLRFMLHPLKSSSSYECDGCTHHASFHSLENKMEDEVRKRWEQEVRDRAEKEEESRPKKRTRVIEYRAHEEGMEVVGGQTNGRKGRSAGVRTRGRTTDNADEDMEVVEVD
ncbi:hypothetical protein P153DRAFT_366074 [Dothidotthia symphoricarpi CBS 119687]|uniref:Uncharacterized protein n=1 Tax=Dothidotthia symphoricarpi CBS 119687 TaxID=1392245 RepID=A0A6A6AHV2_9PLEO|nr:uncharacterized protein P153DRAFT_366074 [Dothidotthia symphoricarpi CBS 119687]KAF2130487.1 hypothetical protein P153DRAFT_366074 [Dothidotthia symphoricarpi CBS 119687]